MGISPFVWIGRKFNDGSREACLSFCLRRGGKSSDVQVVCVEAKWVYKVRLWSWWWVQVSFNYEDKTHFIPKKHYRGRKEHNSSLVAVTLTTYVSFHDTMLLLLTLDSFSAYVHITKADKRSTYCKDEDLFRPHVLNNNETIYIYICPSKYKVLRC